MGHLSNSPNKTSKSYTRLWPGTVHPVQVKILAWTELGRGMRERSNWSNNVQMPMDIPDYLLEAG